MRVGFFFLVDLGRIEQLGLPIVTPERQAAPPPRALRPLLPAPITDHIFQKIKKQAR